MPKLSTLGAALLLLLAFAAPSLAEAQMRGTIRVHVQDEFGGFVQGARLRIARLNAEGMTDSVGEYRFVVPDARIEVTLTVEAPGFNAISHTFVPSPDNLDMTIVLSVSLESEEVAVMSGGPQRSSRSRTASSVPAAYWGRWAPNARACSDDGRAAQLFEIDAGGWRRSDSGSRVTSRAAARRGIHYFRMESFRGGEEHSGSLALRMAGTRLAMSETVAGGVTHQILVRCR